MCIAGLANAGSVLSQKFFKEFNGGTNADFQLGTFMFTIAVLALIFLIMHLFIREESGKESPKIAPRVMIFIAIAFTMTYLAQFFSTEASGKIDAAVLYPLSYVISMPLVFLVDVIFFKEKVTVNNLIGIVLVTASGILINL
jgi:drug/metabolite transporter (DMT)-like permease